MWRFDYDRAGRLIGETDYNGAHTTYRVDVARRVVARMDALGRETTTDYDAAGRIVATSSEVDGRTEFRFNRAGELVQAANADAVVDLERDPASGAVIGESINGIVSRWHVDPIGRRATRTVEVPAAAVAAGHGRWVSQYGWSAGGTLSTVTTYADTSDGDPAQHAGTGSGAGVVDGLRFGYDRSGREISRAMGARAHLAQRFDVRDRLIEQSVTTSMPGQAPDLEGTHSGPAVRPTVARRRWSYRRDSYVVGCDDAVTGPVGVEVDATGRITACTPTGRPAVAERFSYTPAGLLDSVSGGLPTVGVASSPVAGPAATGGDRRVSRRGTLITRIGRDRFVYDAAGQLVQRRRHRLSRGPEVTRFTYTSAGQIRTVVCADGSTWRYGYDPFGRRVSKTHTAADGRLLDTVVFGWDGDDVVAQTNIAHTARGQVPAGAASTWIWTYHPDTGEPLEQHTRHHTPTHPANGSDGGGQGGAHPPAGGDPAGWSQAQIDDEFHAIVADLSDAPTELVDPVSGQVVGRATRTVWGDTRWQGVGTPLRFAGQQYDPETGLHYNRYRYYNPATTTYTSPDPLGIAPNPNSATAYVHNPHTWIDPLGLACKPPNPFGRRGSPAHVARIAEAEKRLGARGYRTVSGGSLPEQRIAIPAGGHKAQRFADLVMHNPDSGRNIAIQVGRATKGGNPVAREVKAISDLRSSGAFDHVFFLKYN